MATGLFLLQTWTESFNGHVEAFPFLARPYPASPWQVEESPAPVAETGVGSPSRVFSGGLLMVGPSGVEIGSTKSIGHNMVMEIDHLLA